MLIRHVLAEEITRVMSILAPRSGRNVACEHADGLELGSSRSNASPDRACWSMLDNANEIPQKSVERVPG